VSPLPAVTRLTVPPGATPRTRQPQVVAHRGASAELAEHTLAAYERAIEQGADALECDVRLTADGHLVCVHDRRIDRTSDGHGVVSAKTLDQLARQDFSRPAGRHRGWRTPWGLDLFTDLDDEADEVRLDGGRGGDGGLLTLTGLLDLVTSAPRRVELAVETKHPTRYAGYVEQAVVTDFDRFGLARPRRGGPSLVRVMSFSQVALRRMRELAPGVPTVYLMDDVPIRFRHGSLPYAARVAGPSIEVIRNAIT